MKKGDLRGERNEKRKPKGGGELKKET